MRFKAAALDQIGQFICGDNPLPFPYRSSSKLTSFFTGLGLDYIHRGETRNAWTRDAVIDINQKAPKDTPQPSPEMVAVIEEVMNPHYFQESEFTTVNYDAALEKINLVLRQYQLEVMVSPQTGTAKLISIDGHFVSSAHADLEQVQKITFSPRAFVVPKSTELQHDLVAVMMPFDAAFTRIYEAIKQSCSRAGLRCKRVDDIWANSTIIQDIFDLIFVAEIIVVDFSTKNPNVMYETGIAHTLGKHVVPITQSMDHVPFDLQSHRVLQYHPNSEGIAKLSTELSSRLLTLVHGHSWAD